MSTQSASDIVDAHPTQSLKGLKAPQLGLKQTVNPVNCFQLCDGVFQEGIQLSNSSSNRPVLFVGDSFYLMINDGAKYDNAVLTTAGVRMAGPSGKLPVLEKRPGDDRSALVFINTRFPRVKGAILKDAFTGRIVTDGKVIAWEKHFSEMLIKLEDGQSVKVFYADGSVRQVICENGTVKVVDMSLVTQAFERVAFLLTCIQKVRENKKMDDERRTRATDRFYHELIAVMRIAGKKSEAVFTDVYSYLENVGEALNPGVQRHVIDVLKEQNRDMLVIQFRASCTPTTEIGATATQTRKGLPAAAKAKKAERAERDRQNARKGPSGGKSDFKGPTNPKSIKRREKAHAASGGKKK